MSFRKLPSFFLKFSDTDMRGEDGHFYEFKSYRLNPSERQLLNGDARISLTPKAFDVLAVLVERAGHLVEKEELMQLVWPDSFVEEANVARIVHMLRKILREDENGNKFIETVAKKGYRFVAPVSVAEPDMALNKTNGTSSTPHPEILAPDSPVDEIEIRRNEEIPHTLHGFRWAFVLLSIAIVVAVAGWIGSGRSRFQGSAASPNGAITSNTDAFLHFKEGMLQLEKRKWDDQDAALEHFDQAIRIDPNFADAYAGRAAVRLWQYLGSRANADMAQARRDIDHALELDPSSSFAHLTLCRMKVTYDWDFAKGEEACRKAIELDPNNQDAHFELAMFRSMFGRVDEALSEIDTAIRLAPTSFNKRARANIFYFAERYDEAIEQARQIPEGDPEFTFANGIVIKAAEKKGDYDQAFDALITKMKGQDKSSKSIETLRSKYSAKGWPGVLRSLVDEFEPPKENQLLTGPIKKAGMYCQLGEFDKAYEMLDIGFQQRNLWMIFLAREPELEPMRKDKRFQDLVERIGLN